MENDIWDDEDSDLKELPEKPIENNKLLVEVIGAILAIGLCSIDPIVGIIGFVLLGLYAYTG